MSDCSSRRDNIGKIIFANNPVSGLFIIMAVATADYRAMFAALLMSSLSFLFAKILQQDVLGILNGFFGYNSVLHAIVSVGYLPKVYEVINLNEPKFWLFLIFATLISVYITSAFANLFRYIFHYPLPCFTLPFNVLQYVLIFCLLHNAVPPGILSNHLLEPHAISDPDQAVNYVNESHSSFLYLNNSLRLKRDTLPEVKRLDLNFTEEVNSSYSELNKNASNETHLNWGETFSGTIAAVSQVYGLNNIPSSALIFLALVLYSPTTAMFCYFGSLLGTLLGVFLSPDYERVYSGSWGYNGLLCSGALAGFGFVLTPQSALLAGIAVIFCTAFQHFITPFFISIGVPIFHIPFLVTTIIFLLVTAEVEKALPRPGIYTYPERHRRLFKAQFRKPVEGYVAGTQISEPYVSSS